MTYWLCILNRENWKTVYKKNIWGVSERHKNTIATVSVGDQLLFYVVGEAINGERLESAVCGRGEVVSDVYKDTKRIFKSAGKKREIYPLRIKLKNVVQFPQELRFKPLISHLDFITNKRRWSGHIQGKAMRQIPEHDFNVIVRTAESLV
ncbi:MAG: EVE domain-containing protein [Candidatus Methanofastidiosia archaeon]|jgi:predicted RNA-binding protein